MIKVVHVDDSALELARAELVLRQNTLGVQFQLRSVSSFEECRLLLDGGFEPDCIILDVVMGEEAQAGLNSLLQLRARNFRGAAIMMSNIADPQLTIACMRAGATDFISKGFDDSELPLRICKACGCLEALQTNETTEMPPNVGGRSLANVYSLIPDIIRSQVRAVLVTGETGTGKELVAEGLQKRLPAGMPFVPVNCAAIKEELLESELFGHEKGSFTGAMQQHRGLFAVANGGWIFLDEVARLSGTCQAALLRILESGELRAVGSNKIEKVQVRVLAATNEDLEAMVAAGKFRGDLLLRLAGYRIKLSPLREREDELPEIIQALLHRLSENEPQGRKYQLTPALLAILANYSWKEGNVRELWQTLQGLTVRARSHVIGPDCIPPELLAKLIVEPEIAPLARAGASATELKTTRGRFPIALYDLEDDLFLEVLRDYQATYPNRRLSQRRIAADFGISRKALQGYLGRLDHKKVLPADCIHLLSQSDASGTVAAVAWDSPDLS